jgi:hypothetical protein
MKKSILLQLITLLYFHTLYQGQNNISFQKCGTEDLPQQFETWLQSLPPIIKPGKTGNAMTQSVFNIPVIVHVVHNNENVNSLSATSGNNLNAAQIIDQINILNKDFNGTNADTTLIPAVFKPLLGKFQFNFCLAVVNPTGGVLAEPGIDRINRVSKGWGNLPYSMNTVNTTVKPNSIWDPNRYFNIWACPLSGGTLGFATFPNPGTSGLQGLAAPFGSTTTDGVVISNQYFGSIGTAQFTSFNLGRTATHEVGHWLGLRHIWGDSNCGNDFCADTPPAQSANSGCVSHPRRLGTCSGNTTGEMFMNYMDYSDDQCLLMFTNDQKNRAQLIMTNSPMRATLLTSTVCNLPSVGNDAGITFVAKPTYMQNINCNNNFINPVINITNYGSTTLTSLQFNYNVNGVNTQTFSWQGSSNPGSSFTVALPQISNLLVGSHVFSVNITLPNGQSDNNLTNNNSIQQFKVASTFTFSSPSVTACIGTTTVVTASGANTYVWSNGATSSSIVITPTASSVYTVIGTIGSCSNPQTVSVNVQQFPTVTVNKNAVCANSQTTLTASGASTYLWDNGATTNTIDIHTASPISHTVTGYTSAGCASSLLVNIQVNPQPIPLVTINHLSCDTCEDGSASISASGGNGPYSYNWLPGNLNSTSISNLKMGCYTVTITDALGCKSLDSACISFDTGINNRAYLTSNKIKVWPNPSDSKFIFELNVHQEIELQIIDAIGKQIQHFSIKDKNLFTIDLSGCLKGLYFAKIIEGNEIYTLKIMKE